MKRVIIGLILLAGVFVAAQPVIDPIKPIAVKPVLGEVKAWYMYGKLMSRSQKVTNRDGSTYWLESDHSPLPGCGPH